MSSDNGVFSVSLTFQRGIYSLHNRYIKELYFIEDICSFCVTGKLTFIDVQGIIEFGPLVGDEKITIVYGNDNTIVKTFKIYKIFDIE